MSIESRTKAALDTYYGTGGLKAAAAAAFVFPSSMTWSGGRSFASLAPRQTLWRNADPTESSAVMNNLFWITRNFGQGEFQVQRTDRKGNEIPIDNHPLQQLIERPNAWYGGQTLWAATLLSYHLDGNAYWIKVRNARGFGVPTELWYEPHWSITPHWPDDGSEFIDYYERRVNGTIQRIDPANVVHLRQGLNPANPRMGLSPLRAALLDIYSDQEVSAWVAALCQNMAIPGVIVNPTTPIGMSPDKAEQIKQTWKKKFGGDNRGEPLILDFEASVTVLGYNPKDMDFAAIHHHAESRICGALGVPPQLTFMDVGNQASSFNNLTTFERIGWEHGIVPVYENFEDTLDTQLLPDFESDPIARGVFCEFNTSDIRALKEAQGEKEQRIRERVTAGIMTVADAQSELGMTPDPLAAYYLLPNTATPSTSAIAAQRASTIPQPSTTPTDPNATPGQPQKGHALSEAARALLPLLKKGFDWEGMTLGRAPTELEAMVIKAVDGLMSSGAATIDQILLLMQQGWAEELADGLDGKDPADFGSADVTPGDQQRSNLILSAISLFARAAALILQEFVSQGGSQGESQATATADDMGPIIDAGISRLRSDTIARAIFSASQAVLLGQPIGERIRNDFAEGSTAYVDAIAGELANTIIARGRAAEIAKQGAQIDFLIYSAVLDQNTCQPCGLADGLTGQGQGNDIPDVPNPECYGGARCRCIHIAALKPEAKA